MLVRVGDRKHGSRQKLLRSQKLSTGDRIDIAASSGRLPTVRSSSVVPDGSRLHKVVLAESSTDAGYDRQIRITFSDDPQTEDYYGVRVMKKHIIHIPISTGQKTDG